MSTISTTPSPSSTTLSESAPVAVAGHVIESRLPRSVRPRHYELELTPDLAARTFEGKVEIEIEIKQKTNTILLNAVEIQVKEVTIKVGESRTIKATNISLNEKDEICTLTFSESLEPGTEGVRLILVYSGILNDQMRGFYASTYKDANGVEQVLATTQFEATDCRRAVPCWDEPAIKSTWTVTIIAPSTLKALSNMPAIRSEKLENQPGFTRHVFDRTPLISTYLLAFIVGQLDEISGRTSEGTLVRCFTTPGKVEQARFALDVAIKLLPYYNSWFDIAYPLPKLDMVAVPDFSAGAMENWGLVTYREAALLIDPKNSSSQTKQWVAVCVAHEISHQWFGNLVTMEWWTHLWLNEGFATWMENHAVDVLFPQFQMWQQFVYGDLNSSFELDALESSHPIEVPIHHANEVDEIFDIISYSKGCVVIRMLEAFLGSEDFKKGLQVYMKKFQYSNALTEDLWQVLSEVSGKDVQAMMQSWTKQTGFPIIQLEESSNASSESKLEFAATQTRFMHTGPASNVESLWPVPINFIVDGMKVGSKPLAQQVLSGRTGTLTLDLAGNGLSSSPKWIKLNAGQAYMYRVLYPKRLFDALCVAIGEQDPLLTASDRLGFVNDSFALARCGLVSTTQLLQLVQSFEREKDYTVWADILSNLADLALIVREDEAVYALFCRYVTRLLDTILKQVGWEAPSQQGAGAGAGAEAEAEGHTTALLRSKLIAAAAKYQHRETIENGCRRFVKFFAKKKQQPKEVSASASASSEEKKQSAAEEEEDALSPDLRSAVYSMVVANGGVFGYESMLHLRALSDLSEEQVRCLQSLASTPDQALIQRTLEYAISTNVRNQDGPSLIAACAHNRKASLQTWLFIQANWPAILKRFQQSSALSRIIASVGNNLTSPKHLDEFRNFFEQQPHPGADRAVKQALERIASNAAWVERDFESTAAWLKANVKEE